MTAKTFSKDVVTEIGSFLEKFPRAEFSYIVVSNTSGEITRITSQDNNIQKYAKDLGLK
jgi:hypothetical protein